MDEYGKLTKVTVALPTAMVERLRALAASRRVPSANFVVRDAVARYLIDLEREDFRAAMDRAAADPDFLKDVAAVEEDFRHCDAETARMMPEW